MSRLIQSVVVVIFSLLFFTSVQASVDLPVKAGFICAEEAKDGAKVEAEKGDKKDGKKDGKKKDGEEEEECE